MKRLEVNYFLEHACHFLLARWLCPAATCSIFVVFIFVDTQLLNNMVLFKNGVRKWNKSTFSIVLISKRDHACIQLYNSIIVINLIHLLCLNLCCVCVVDNLKITQTHVKTCNLKIDIMNYKICRSSHFGNVLVGFIFICCLLKLPFMQSWWL